MSTITYTDFFDDFSSSLVDSVAYDRPTQAAYVDLNDEVYRYDNVPVEAVEALVNADSVGRAFNGSFMSRGFKQKFGPGTHIGNWASLSYEERPSAPVVSSTTSTNGLVGKNLTYAPNATVDGQTISDNVVTPDEVRVSLGVPTTTANPVRVALKVPSNEVPDTAGSRKYTVHFESNGEKTHTLEATSVEDALKQVASAADMLGVRVKVTGVFVHLV